MPLFTAPTVGSSNGTWGTELNVALALLNSEFKRKTANESVNTSTALQDDNDLVVPVVASGVYLLRWDLKIDGAVAGDFKYAFTGPASATMTWNSTGHAVGATAATDALGNQDATAIGTNITHGTIASGTSTHVSGNGILVVSATAGNLTLQWAQGTSSGTDTKVLIGSWLYSQRMA